MDARISELLGEETLHEIKELRKDIKEKGVDTLLVSKLITNINTMKGDKGDTGIGIKYARAVVKGELHYLEITKTNDSVELIELGKLKGEKGDSGRSGEQGEPGKSATIEIVKTDIGIPQVKNVGTSQDVKLEITLPKPEKAAAGPAGQPGRDGKDGKGINWRGPWKRTDTYKANDAVEYLGSSYIATADVSGVVPSMMANNWSLMAKKGRDGASGSGGGSSALSDLTDVDLADAENGQSLVYVEASGKWQPIMVSGGGGGSSELVLDTSPQLGGDLESNGNDLLLADTDALQLGNSQMRIYGDTGTLGQGALLFTGSNPDLQRSLYFSGSFSIYSHAGATGSGISAPEFTMLDAEAYIRANGVSNAVFSVDMDNGLRIRTNGRYGTLQTENLTGERTYQLPDEDGTLTTQEYVDTGLSTKVSGTTSITVSDTPPDSPAVGDLWVDTN